MQKKTKAKKIKTEDFLSADNIDHKPLIRSKIQLSPKAVSRILRITRIPVTESIQKLACQHLIESGLANEFETYRNGMIHEKSPAQTKKDLEKCIKSIKIIHKITTREKMDESLSSDFLMAYISAQKEFGADYAPSLDKFTSLLKSVQFVFEKALKEVDGKVGENPAHTESFEISWLDQKLEKIFIEIFNRTPAVNSRTSLQDDHDSPFLRFSSQTMKEMRAIGCDIDERSHSPKAIRKRHNRNRKSKTITNR